jgi:hypothetical protein
MAQRFAVVSGNWSSGATWDDGVGPVSGDTVYPNGFAVTIDQDINVGYLHNAASTVTIPKIATPVMLNNTSPSGTVISSNNASNAYVCFNQDGSVTNYWTSGVQQTGWIGYTFTSSKIIKRYILKIWNTAAAAPKTWTFEGSNDGFATAGVVLDNIPSYTTNANYISSGLTNTTGFTSYRINITAVQGSATAVLCELEMSESSGSTYGSTAGGYFTVPNTLVGVRNLLFSSTSGCLYLASGTYLLLINATSGNTVNISAPLTTLDLVNGSGNPLASAHVIYHNNTCNLNINGNLYGTATAGGTSGENSSALYINTTASLSKITINGNIYGGNANWSNGATAVWNTSALSEINVNGTLFGSYSTTIGIGSAIYSPTALTSKINIVGNLTPLVGPCMNVSSPTITINGNIVSSTLNVGITSGGAPDITITGNVTSSTNIAINVTGAAVVKIPTGTVTASSSNPAIKLGATGIVTLAGPIVNVSNQMAIMSGKIRFYSGQTAQWTFQDTTNSNITLSSISSSGITIGLPLSGDVRYLTTYGQNNEYVGSLRVPSVDNVRKGVQTDFTVGTADLTANDIFSAITTSSNSVAVRLRNVSTVQSAGDQIASLS